MIPNQTATIIQQCFNFISLARKTIRSLRPRQRRTAGILGTGRFGSKTGCAVRLLFLFFAHYARAMEHHFLRGARVYLSGPMDFVASRADEKKLGWRNRIG